MIIFRELGYLGKLGNQYFQIAAAVSHALKMGVDARFPKWKYRDYVNGPIDDSLIMDSDYVYNGEEHFLCHHAQFYYKPLPKNSNLLLNGFFQSDKYWQDKDEVLKIFTPAPGFMHELKSIDFSRFLQNNVTALHVRRGDYIEKKDFHHNLTKNYYKNAASYLSQELNISSPLNVIVFSDDIAWCKESLKDLPVSCFFSEGNSDIVDLYLMAFCKHHIIANSSFSWWGACLAQIFNPMFNYRQEERIVIAPSQWFGDKIKDLADYSTRDLYPEGWNVVKV